jgi:hypothetical protein
MKTTTNKITKTTTNTSHTDKSITNTLTKLAGLYLAAVTAIVAMFAALATGAGAAPPGIDGFQMAKFKVEIEGRSYTSWHNELEAETDCDTSDHSSGTELLTFKTKKPFVITATHFADELNPSIFSGRSTLGVPVTAHVKRNYTPSVTPPAKTCEDNGGGAEPVRYDCGSRTRNWHVEVEFSDEKRNGLQLHGETTATRPYEDCPIGGFGYPELLDKTSLSPEKPLYADLSPDDIFDPKLEKWITIGDGTCEDSLGTLKFRTHVHWTVSFTRLKGK